MIHSNFWKCQIPDNFNENNIKLKLVGLYKLTGTAAVTYKRLSLFFDKTYIIEYWKDIGSQWKKEVDGTYNCENKDMILLKRKGNKYQNLQITMTLNGLHLVEHPSNSVIKLYKKIKYPKLVKCIETKARGNHFFNSITYSRYYTAIRSDSNNTITIYNDLNRLKKYPNELFFHIE